MRKFGVFNGTIFISIILAGLFGIIHDQITYTISPEYFSKFKYLQFNIGQAVPYRLGAIVIGFRATWWTGIFIGLGLSITGLVFPDHITMRKAITKALFIIFFITITVSFIGFLYGKFILTKKGEYTYVCSVE